MSHNIISHLDDLEIWDYAKGNISNIEGVIYKAHIEMCPQCRKSFSNFQDICGILLNNIEGVAMNDDALNIALSRLEEKSNVKNINIINECFLDNFELPKSLQDVKTKKPYSLGKNIWIAPIDENNNNGSQAYFLYVGRGQKMLPHTHTHREITLILHGGFIDNGKEYKKGDIIICDNEIIHEPRVFDDEDCLCVVYQDGPIKPKTLLGHLIKPLARI